MNDEGVKQFGKKLTEFRAILSEFTDTLWVEEIEEYIPNCAQLVHNPIYRAIERYNRSQPAVVGALQEGKFDEARRRASAHIEHRIKHYTLLHAWNNLYYDLASQNDECFKALYVEWNKLKT